MEGRAPVLLGLGARAERAVRELGRREGVRGPQQAVGAGGEDVLPKHRHLALELIRHRAGARRLGAARLLRRRAGGVAHASV